MNARLSSAVGAARKTPAPAVFPDRMPLPYPARGALRWLLRAPLLAYRVGLGDLLNAIHIMVLTTRGRRSGQPRHVPIEYRRHGRKIYLVSAWGSRPDWVQNVKTDPRVTVQLGRRTQAAQALVVTDPAESLRALYLFRRAAPARYDAVLSAVIEETVNARTLPNVSSQFTIVRLDLSDDPPPLTGLPVHREAAGAAALAGLLGMTLLAIWAALRLRQMR